MRIAITFCVSALLLAFVGAPPAAAQDSDQGEVNGHYRIGFRSVDVGGADRKYKEDVNLSDGPRLFDLRFDLSAPEELRGVFDHFELSIVNAGGDPFESFHVAARKYGSYSFKYDRRESDFFYNDIIVPHAQSSIERSDAGDFHTFDFERVRDTAKLDVTLSQRAKINFGFERFTKRGESTTTLDLSRDEFELDRPIHESLNSYVGGFQYSWDKATLVLEERIRDYENVVDIFLPGFSIGENPDDATTVDFFFFDQPYDYTSAQHTARLMARPHERLEVRVSASMQSLDLDATADETSQGIAFTGQPFTTDRSGAGEIDRDVDLYDADFTYTANDRVAIVGGFYQRDLDQQGDFLFDNVLNEGLWQVETTGFEAGVQVAVGSDVVVTVGLMDESRDVTHGFAQGDALAPDSETTDNTGYFGLVDWSPAPGCRLNLSIDDSSYDDPFTLASPTDRQRYRLSGSYRWDNNLSVTGSHQVQDVENGNSGWVSDTEISNLRLSYRNKDVNFSFGYALVDVERSIDQLVTGGFRQDLFALGYQADSDFLDAQLSWAATDKVRLGGYLRSYQNDGSFGLERDDFRGFVEVGVGQGYSLQVGYRTIDYDEESFNFDDYDADIVDVSIGYDFN